MKQVYKIENNGFYIGPVIVDDNAVLTPDLIETPFAEGFYSPKWDGSKWVEGKTSDEILTDAKNAKTDELKVDCQNAILSPFQASNGHTYDFNFKDQINFAQALSLLLSDNTITSIQFPTDDAGVIEHTRADFIQVAKDAEAHKNSNKDKYYQLKSQVDAATTPVVVQTIDW